MHMVGGRGAHLTPIDAKTKRQVDMVVMVAKVAMIKRMVKPVMLVVMLGKW